MILVQVLDPHIYVLKAYHVVLGLSGVALISIAKQQLSHLLLRPFSDVWTVELLLFKASTKEALVGADCKDPSIPSYEIIVHSIFAALGLGSIPTVLVGVSAS